MQSFELFILSTLISRALYGCKRKPVFGEEEGGGLRHGNHHGEEGERQESRHCGKLKDELLVDYCCMKVKV